MGSGPARPVPRDPLLAIVYSLPRETDTMALAKDPDRLPRGAHVFVAMVFSTAIWAVMVFWTLAYLRRISGGLTPFDLRPFGYDLGEARTFLVALSQIGRDYYIDIQLTLDTAF